MENRSEAEVATILRDSLVCLALNIEEGMPRLVIEGMASGCLIAGFGTGALNELLVPGTTFEYGDVVGIAKWLNTLAVNFPDNAKEYSDLIAEQRRRSRFFSQERQTATVCAAWEAILQRNS